MFMLNGSPLAIDTPFTVGEGDDAIQYPANWLRHASADEKAAIGIEELNDPEPYDDRFYWGPGNPKLLDDRLEVKEDGTPLMVQVYDPVTDAMVDSDKQVVTKGTKSMVLDQVKAAAFSLLSPTDYKLVRKVETGEEVDATTTAYRAAVRAAYTANVAAIQAVTTVDALAALQLTWPEQGI